MAIAERLLTAFPVTSAMSRAHTTVSASPTRHLTSRLTVLATMPASAQTALNAATQELTATTPNTDNASSRLRTLHGAYLLLVS